MTPGDEVDARYIDQIADLVDVTELVDVHPERMSAERLSHAGKDDDAPDASPTLAVFQRLTQDELEVRPVLTVQTPQARFLIDLALTYKHSEPVEIAEDVVGEFLHRVAMMNAWPYLREAVQASAARLHVTPPVLGLLRAGQFHVDSAGGQGQPWDIPTLQADQDTHDDA